MNIRLGKAISELNIGLQTAVEFLEKKTELGEVKAEPSFKLNDAQYDALVKAFHKDKEVRNQADKLFPKKTKEKKRTNENNDHRAETVLNEGKQKFTPLGKLDLDSLNGKKTVKNSDVKNAKDDKKEDAKPAAVGEAAQKNQTVAVDKQDKATPVETVKNSAPTQDAKPERLADKQTEPHKNKVEG